MSDPVNEASIDPAALAAIEAHADAAGLDWLRRDVRAIADELRRSWAQLVERDEALARAVNVLDNWVGAIDPNDYDRRFIQAMRRALHSSHWPHVLGERDRLLGDGDGA